MRQRISGLYAITTDIASTARLEVMTQQALSGGAQLVQYRNKTANSQLRREQAQALNDLCRQYDVPLIINDYVELAVEVDADGVHLGGHDVSVVAARSVLGQEKIIGASCYNQLDLALAAESQSADYVAFGAFFRSTTKPEAVVASIDLLRLAKEALSIPVVSIGGISAANATILVDQGCDAIAVSSALFGSQDIQLSSKAFSVLFKEPAVP